MKIMANKMTKKDYFAMVKEMVSENVELVAFVDRELALLDKKNASKSKAQVAKDEATAKLAADVEAMFVANADVAYTATEVAVKFNVTVQKMTAVLTALVNDKVLAREVVKSKANFKLA